MANSVFKLVKANKWDAVDLAVHLSDEDKEELSISQGFIEDELAGRLGDALKKSQYSYSIVNETSGVVYLIGGYTSEGVCWLLTSKYVKSFTLSEMKQFINLLIKGRDEALLVHPYLWNVAWLGNKTHLKFIKLLGATLEEHLQLEIKGKNEMFVKISFKRSNIPYLGL